MAVKTLPGETSLAEKTKTELVDLAQASGLSNARSMRKADLVAALEAATVDDETPSTGGGTAGRVEVEVFDARWLRAAWSVSEDDAVRSDAALGSARHGAHRVVRVLLLTNGGSIESSSETAIPDDARVWFLHAEPGRTYRVVVGDVSGEAFHQIAASDPVHTPDVYSARSVHDGPAGQDFAGLPPEVIRELQAMHGRETPYGLELTAELVLHGQTHAGASVDSAEIRIPVDDDGRFEIVRPLQPGRELIPVDVRSADGLEEWSAVAALEFSLRLLETSEEEDAE